MRRLLILLVLVATPVRADELPPDLVAAFDTLRTVVRGTGRGQELKMPSLQVACAMLSHRGLRPDQGCAIVAAFVRSRSLNSNGVFRFSLLFPALSIAMGWDPVFSAEQLSLATDGNSFALKLINGRIHAWSVADEYKIGLDFTGGDAVRAIDKMLSPLEARFRE